MRYQELTDEDYANEAKEVALYIKRHCSEWLNESNNQIIYRGITASETLELEPTMVLSIPKDRKPTGTHPNTHKHLDKAFKDAGFEASRSNSMFASSDYTEASKYTGKYVDGVQPGHVYVVFPENGYSYTWSHTIRDLYAQYRFLFKDTEARITYSGVDIDDMFESDQIPEDLAESLVQGIKSNYHNTDLAKAISSGNEIMVTGSDYVAVEHNFFRSNVKEYL